MQSKDEQPIQLNYAALGTALSFALSRSSANFAFSIPQMPSFGTVHQLRFAGETLTLDELKGVCALFSVAADAGVGWSGSIMFLGASMAVTAAAVALNPMLELPAILASSTACVRFHGMSSALLPFNVGVTAYFGMVW